MAPAPAGHDEGVDGGTVVAGPASDLAGLGPDVVRPGGLALLVVLGLAVATALLLRNMTVHLRRIDFDESEPAARGDREGPPDGPDAEPDTDTASDADPDTDPETDPDPAGDPAPGRPSPDEPGRS